jgi:hypothetical protein
MYWNTPLPLTAKFADLIGKLCLALRPQYYGGKVAAPLLGLIETQLNNARRRLFNLAARVQAGTLRARAPARPREATPRPADRADRPQQPTRSFGWLIRLVPVPHHLAF